MRRSVAFLALASFFIAGKAQDKLISGPGSTLTETKCKICHELQHIRRAPLSRGEWADNLKNMKERGTPMTDAEMAVMLDYLATYYNREKPAPDPSPDTLAMAGGDPIEGGPGEAPMPARGREDLDAPGIGPPAQGVAVDAKLPAGCPDRQPFGAGAHEDTNLRHPG